MILFVCLRIDNGKRNRGFNSGGDPNHPLSPDIFKEFFIIATINKIGGVGPWWKYALSDCCCVCHTLSKSSLFQNKGV